MVGLLLFTVSVASVWLPSGDNICLQPKKLDLTGISVIPNIKSETFCETVYDFHLFLLEKEGVFKDFVGFFVESRSIKIHIQFTTD